MNFPVENSFEIPRRMVLNNISYHYQITNILLYIQDYSIEFSTLNCGAFLKGKFHGMTSAHYQSFQSPTSGNEKKNSA